MLATAEQIDKLLKEAEMKKAIDLLLESTQTIPMDRSI